MTDYIVGVLQRGIRRCLPLRRQSSVTRPPVKWFNESLKSMRKTVTAVKIVADASGEQRDRVAFNQLRSMYRSELCAAKKNAYAECLNCSQNKLKDGWKIINFERGRPTRCRGQNPPLSAAEFNAFFVSVADNIVKTLPILSHGPTDFFRDVKSPKDSFF